MLAPTAAAHAGITASWTQVPITPAALEGDPQLANMQSWSLNVTTTGNWTSAGIEAFLPPGYTFYNNPLGGNTKPNPAVVAAHPAVAFDTYVTAPSDNGVSGAPFVLGPFPEGPGFPDFGGTTGRFSVSWGEPINDPPGTYEIARLTFTMLTPPDPNTQSITTQVNPEASTHVFPITPLVTNRCLPDADGNWHVPQNWLWGRVPGSRDFVVLDVGGNAIRTIAHSQGNTLVLNISSQEHILLTGGTLQTGGISTASLTISGGTLRQATVAGAPAVFGPAGGRLVGVTLNQGMIVSHPAPVIVESGLTLNGASTISTGTNLRFEGSQTLGGSGMIAFDGRGQIDVTAAATLSLGSALRVQKTGNEAMRINGRFVQNSGSTIDLIGGSLINDYTGGSPLATIRARIISGYNNGSWNGTGIRSSTAASDPTRAVGYAEASDLFSSFPALFEGETIDDTTVIALLTRYGDANLDRVVNLLDFDRLAANFGSSNAFWDDGDFTYDGFVGLADFNRLAGNFGLSAGLDEIVDPQDWANLASVVPEPAFIGFLFAGVLRKRRR